MEKNSKIPEACAWLHNFVINKDCEFDDVDEFDDYAFKTVEAMKGSPLGWRFSPPVKPLQPIPDTLWTCNAIVQHVYWKPVDNAEHQVQELHELGLL